MKHTALRLAELAADKPHAFVGGPFGSKLTSADYVAEGVPVIRGANLTAGRYLNDNDFVYVSEQKMRTDLTSNLANRGDIVFTQRGTLGQVSIIPPDAKFDTYVISQSQMKLSVDETKADVRFIYYWFSSSETVERIISRNSSSGVPHINLTVLRNFEIPVPPLREQKRIADVLSTYDDLIENNRRRIALLEQAARLLYREWFVHLRFPGHEHVGVIDGVPKGWARATLGEMLTLQRGHDLPDARRVQGDVPVVSSSGISGWHNEMKATGPGVVTGRYGTLGNVYYINGSYWPLNTALYVRDFKESPPIYVYHLLQYTLQNVQSNSGAVPGLNRNVLHDWKICMPPLQLRYVFAEYALVLEEQITTLNQFNGKLAQARDLLLPRLMSGEIAV